MTRTGIAAALCAALALVPARAAEPKRLTNDELAKALTKLGYETKALDKVFTQVVVERTGWRSVIRASLSTDETIVWFDAWFVSISHPEDVPAETWRKLLAKNDEIAPTAFAVNTKNKRLYLSVSFPNADVTPVELRKQLEALDALVEKTRDLWKLDNFVPPLTAAGEKELTALAGTWVPTEFNDVGTELSAEETAKFAYKFDGPNFQLLKDGKVLRSGRIVPTPGAKGLQLDRYDTTDSRHGIAKRDGDTLTWCFSVGARPTKFAGDAKSETSLLVLKRQK
jgi:uncharacterized protein (TIGR03067 family)